MFDERGRNFWRRGVRCAAVSAAVLFRYEQASISARTAQVSQQTRRLVATRTLQSVNSPLLELLEGDLCSWGDFVEVQSVGIILLLEDRGGKLFLLGVQSRPPLWINFAEILPDHVE